MLCQHVYTAMLLVLGPNKKQAVLRVTLPYLNLLVKPRFFKVFWKKYNFMYFERRNSEMLKIKFFPRKSINKKYECLHYLKFSDPLPETLFYLA